MPGRQYLRRRAQRQNMQHRRQGDQQNENEREPEIGENLHDLGPMDQECDHCGAFRWRDENASLCCARGQVTLPPLQPPPELFQNLLTDNSAEAKHFRDNIRGYNSALAFASLGVNEDILPPGIYCFRISGEVHHLIGPLMPQANERPRFAQMYIYDTNNEAQNRHHWNNNLNPELLRNLQEALHVVNPYVQVYKHAADVIQNAGNRAGEVRMVLKADPTKDPRRYNLPQASEIAVILPDMPCDVTARDIVLYRHATDDPRGTNVVRISEMHPHYDPLHYVLLFPHGEDGWRINIRFQGNRTGQVTCMQFYAYRLMKRQEFSAILHGGRLLQQYVVDQYAKMELQRLKFLRLNQSTLRAELYQGLSDAVVAGDVEGATVGRTVVLPATFTGSPRSMIQLYQDAMSIVRKFGKPDLFITFTCNPNWQEIKRELNNQQTPADRPDLVARVFKMKCASLMKDLVQHKLFGTVAAYVRVVEFQKRGLPHVHILLILEQDSKLNNTEDVDRIVKAELPLQQPHLRALVERNMMHGPCGTAFPHCPCMKDGKCSKSFPKDFADVTILTEKTYPSYQRRDSGATAERNGAILDNRWIVPYNPTLLEKYEAHINVEVCSSITAVKYLYKYVYKGHDRVMIQFQAGANDEIQRYVDARYVSASEACWRLFHFELQDRYPSIQRLALHLPNQQSVVYREGQAQQAVNNVKDTTLTAWFKANTTFPEARNLYYHEMPEKFTWDAKTNAWKPRQRQFSIGRLYNACPSEGERFFLRLLLQHKKGAHSFEDIRTLQDGTVCPTFREAASLTGLLQDDQEWSSCLEEAAFTASPAQMRRLFAMILIFCEPSDPAVLWNTFSAKLSEDFDHEQVPPHHSANFALLEIKKLLQVHKREPSDFGLPDPVDIGPNENDENWNPLQQSIKSAEMVRQLNEDQKAAYDAVMSAVDFTDNEEVNLFFIDGPGGSGKTFLYNTLLSQIRGRNQTAIAVASSGIAAELLDGGRTAHSTFKIPIPIEDHSTCSISRQSAMAQRIREAALIIWDEAPMMDRRVFECVSRTVSDITGDMRFFGGKVVVLGGDFRQILPVVRKGGEADIINASLHKSYLWRSIRILRLRKNMRANSHDAQQFDEWLRKIGDGTEETCPDYGESVVKMPAQLCIPPGDINNLITAVFPNLERNHADDTYLAERAILTTTNEYVDDINRHVLDHIPTAEKIYYSADSIGDPEQSALYPTEFLNSISLPGIAAHKLCLKQGTPVMLLRNLDPKAGLLNGTRMIVTHLGQRIIEARILTGPRKNSSVFIPRITLTPSDSGLPFDLRRRQFPVKQSYAMTVNKAQGQTLSSVGIYLPSPVFTHGQLYVALSRARSFNGISLMLQDRPETRENPFYTDNVVYKSVLQAV